MAGYFSDPSKKTAEETIERNTKTDEQDLSTLKNYKKNQSGIDATQEEKEQLRKIIAAYLVRSYEFHGTKWQDEALPVMNRFVDMDYYKEMFK